RAGVYSHDFAECIALFLIGGVLCGVHGWAARRGDALRVAAIAVLVAVALVGVGFYEPLRQLRPWKRTFLTHYVLVPTLLFGFLALWRDDESTRASRLAGELGKLTYSIYMIHFPVQLVSVILVDGLKLKRAVFYSVPAVVLFVATVLALGFLVFRYFEMPMQAYVRRRLLPPRPQARDPGAPARLAAGG
ncbi:MAG: acyltransferase family protein, partial [Anaeromyxobacteraceae bacterium]